jgi:hypothetical protein
MRLKSLLVLMSLCLALLGEAKIIETAHFEDVMPYIEEDLKNSP